MNEEEIQGPPVMATLAEEAKSKVKPRLTPAMVKTAMPTGAKGKLGIKSLTRSRRMASQNNRARVGAPYRNTPFMKLTKMLDGNVRAREASKNNGRRSQPAS